MHDARWEEVAQLEDGTEVRLRFIRPEDKQLLEHGFTELSPESRISRFFTARKSLSAAELAYLTELDQENHVALGAGTLDGSEGLGVARFIREADGSDAAEAAVVVVEGMRRRGLALLLLKHLAAAAQERGVERFRFSVRAANRPMLTLLRRSSASVVQQEGDVITYEWVLPPSRASTCVRGSPSPLPLRGPEMNANHLALMIRQSARKYAGRTAIRYKAGASWHSISYRDLEDRIRTAAKALLELGIREGDKVGIFSPNCPEWAIADFAILSIGAVSVAIYATDTAKEAEYIARDAELRLVFAGGRAQYDKVKAFIGSVKALEKVVVFDETVAVEGADWLGFGDFMECGRTSGRGGELDAFLERAESDDVATLIYTSGTTGVPKGAILTHANFFHQFSAVDDRFTVGSSDRSLCFLPLSHSYERAWSYYVFRCGAENDYIPDPKRVLEYLAEVKPTVMVSVPLLYEKIYAGVHAELEKASAPKKRLFGWAVRTGKRYNERKLRKQRLDPVLALEHSIADRLVLHKIRDVIGGPKNFLSAGGAPLSRPVEEFFFAAGILVCQGYGLTETAPMISCNAPGAFKFGTVGRPIEDVEVRIGEFGEILVRGPNVMKGYHNKPEETQRAFVDGWFRTGDIGDIDEDGYLRITDRIKDLIITAGGKNVAPQHIENTITLDPYIEHVVTLGDERKFLAAIVVPQFAALEEYARARAIPFSSRSELVQRADIIDFYRARIDERSADLAPYERLKRFALLDHELTQDGGELTPTQKIKRKAIATKYANLIEQMYSGVGAPPSPARGPGRERPEQPGLR
jgi:long-chain acyl-CoA synthetase